MLLFCFLAWSNNFQTHVIYFVLDVNRITQLTSLPQVPFALTVEIHALVDTLWSLRQALAVRNPSELGRAK